MKRCCESKCKNTFEGPGLRCPACKQKTEPRMRPKPSIAEQLIGQRVPTPPIVERKEEPCLAAVSTQ